MAHQRVYATTKFLGVCVCGKTNYDKRSAQTARNKRMSDEHIALRIYQCERGDYWHLTSQDPYREEIRLKRKKWQNHK